MNVTRRDFLKASAAIAGALALQASGLMELQKAMAGGANAPPVIWLQGQSCTGCSVSLLNSTYYMTIDQLLINTLDLKFHPTVMAAAGTLTGEPENKNLAVSAAEDARVEGGYVLVIEGAIPTGANGDYCHIWPGMTMIDAIGIYGPSAAAILAVGTCACYGGMAGGEPNPTGAMGVKDALAYLGLQATVINIPGCPAHPDWIVGTVAALLAGETPELDNDGRPEEFFGTHVHKRCPNRGLGHKAHVLGEAGCLAGLGCRGQQTHADCPLRKWNAGWAKNLPGQPAEPLAEVKNWCVGARNPCQGCTEPDFPDGMSPFYHIGRRTKT